MSIFSKGSEAGFLFAIKGAPATEVISFEAGERLMEPFVVDVNLASPTEIQYEKVMAQEALLTITAQGANRYFHGIVTKFEHAGKVGSTPLSYQYLYTARMVPFTQLLSLEQDCRIFQNKNVQDIIADIFKDSNIPSDRYDFRLKNKDHQRRYCVQNHFIYGIYKT